MYWRSRVGIFTGWRQVGRQHGDHCMNMENEEKLGVGSPVHE